MKRIDHTLTIKIYLLILRLTSQSYSIIFLILLACSSGSEKVVFTKVHLDKKVSILSDSSFFGNVWDVNCYGNQLLISDRTSNRLVLCDTSFKLVKSIGRAGNGPGELQGPMHNCIKDNYIYTFDDGNKTLSVFSMQGEFVKRITYSAGLIPFYRFVLDDSLNVFISDVKSGSSLSKLDTSSRKAKPFGEATRGSLKEERDKLRRHVLLSNDNQFICVGVTVPVIEIYNKGGKKIKEFDLSQDPFLKSILDYVENRKSRCVLFQDVYLVGSHLYLLLAGVNHLNEPNREKILVYTINSKELQFVKALNLGDEKSGLFYDTFAVSEDEKRIFAYERIRNEWRVFSQLEK